MSTGVPSAALPAIVPLDSSLISEHRAVHRELGERLDAVDAAPRWLFTREQRRLIVESVAHVFTADGAALFPPRRRFLGAGLRARLLGCDTAFRHLDARSSMWRGGSLGALVGRETPMVLNALAESRDPDGRETNPGLIRATDAEFDPTETTFRPPPSDQCAALVSGAVDRANDSDTPSIVRAGWLCAVMLSVHPFVDGNGRTSRLLFQLVASADLPSGLDWGAVAEWSQHRRPYVDALKASQRPSAPEFSGELVDVEPFEIHACLTSIVGAQRALHRLECVAAAWSGDWNSRSDEHRRIEVATALGSTSTLDELFDVVSEPNCTEKVGELVDDGRLEWAGGLLRSSATHPLTAPGVTIGLWNPS